MDTISMLQDSLEYIDQHLKEELSANCLAARAGFSTWHFGKLFQWGVGLPVMRYVRSRRLAFAAYEIKKGRRIIDISVEYDFETHSGFSKAFRRYWGYSPEEYRKCAPFCEYPTTPSLPRMNDYLIGGIVMEPKFVTLPAIKLAGFLLKTKVDENQNLNEIPGFWQAYITDGRMEQLHKEVFLKRHAEYGVCFPEEQETGEFDYVIGIERKEDQPVPASYHTVEIPAANYAVFSTPPCDEEKFVPAIQGVWEYIMNDWFPKSGYEYAPGCADFEFYDDQCMSEKAKVCAIYIPVVKK